MGVPVTVDSDDLGVLLQVTAVIKNVEAALRPSPDRAVEQARPLYKAAHDTLAGQWNAAKRAANPDFAHLREPLTDKALGRLRVYAGQYPAEPGEPTPIFFVTPGEKIEAQELASKGMVIFGVVLEGIQWAGSDTPIIKLNATRYACRITAKGYEAAKQEGKAVD